MKIPPCINSKKICSHLNKNSILTLIAVVIFFGFMYQFTIQYSQSFRFVDEDEHMTIGFLMTKGEKLYTDISTNHQPVNYILSYGLQKVVQIPNLFMLLKRHREFIYLFNFFWAMVLAIRFGWKTLPFIFIYELVKFTLLGNEYIAESLTVYPFAYVLTSQLELMLYNKKVREDLLLGMISMFLVATLLPLVLPLFLLALYRYVIAKVKWWKDYLLGSAIIFGIVWLFVSPIDYFRETWLNNWLYAIPRLSKVHGLTDYLNLGLFPLRVLIEAKFSWLQSWMKMIVLAWLVALIIFVLHKKRKMIKIWLAMFLLWVLINPRELDVNSAYYSGIHLLPWLGMGLVAGTYMLVKALEIQKSKVLSILVLVIVIGASIWQLSKPGTLFSSGVDPMTENYVQLTPITESGNVINSLKSEGDTLMVFPNEAILHWYTGLKPADYQVTHYEWQFFPPRSKEKFVQALEVDSPEFIQLTDDNSSYIESVSKVIGEDYILIFENPNVFINMNKLNVATDEQWGNYNQLPFEKKSYEDIEKERIENE